MADILKYRKADGSTVEVPNNTTITLDHTVASIDLAIIVDQPGLDQGEVRGWISQSPSEEGPFISGQYGLTISLEQGQSKSVLIKTVQAHTLENLANSIFEKVVDTFTITVSRNNAPADSVTDSVPINFLIYPDSEASLAIVNASFELLDSSGFDIVDSSYVRARQNRNFDFLINLPKSIDSVGITRSLFDSDVRKSTSVTDVGGDGSLTYNNSTGIITYTGPSASEVRSHFSAGGDLSYDSSTGLFQFDVEQVYTRANFDSDFNMAIADYFVDGDGLKFDSATKELQIDSAELSSYFRQDIRSYISGTDAGGDGSFSYNTATGVITYTGPSAAEVRAHFTGNKGLIYNSSTGNFDVDSANLRTIISANDAGGDGSFSYNNTTGVFTYTGPSASEVRSHFSAGGDLSYDSSTGVFQFDVEQVYTKENFDSDFNLTLDSAVLEGFGLKYDNNTNTLSIDSSELQSYFRQDIRSYISADKGLVYNSTTGNFDVDSANLRTIISATDAGGDGSFAYNNSTGVFTYTGPSATEVRNHFTGGTGIAISSGDIKIDSSELTSLYRQTIRTYLNVVDAGGDGSFSYDSTLGKFTYTGPSASEVRAHLTANKGLSVSSGEFNIDSANVRGMLSGGTGVTYTAGSGVIAIGQPVATTDSVTFAGMTVSGNLQVTGTTTTVNSTTLDVADKNITIAKGAANAAAADGGGITVDGAGATLTYAATGDKFVFNKPFEGSFLGADSNFDASLATKTTTNLAEGNNLYYTTARADSAARSALIAVDAGGDGSFTYDSATGKFTYTGPSAAEVRAHFTGGAGIGLASGDIKIDSSELYSLYKHDDFADFVADEHVAHSGVSVIAGTGLTGGGDITTSKTLNVIGGKGIIANADDIQIDSTNIKGMLAATDAGGDGSFAYNNSTGVFTYTGPSASEVRAHFTGGTGITYNAGTGEFTTTDADIVHDNLSGFVANEHIDHTTVSIIAGKGLTGGGTIASSRTLNIDSANIRSMFSAGGDLSYNSGTGQFSFDVEQVYTKANFDSDFNVAIDSATTSDLSEGTNLYYTTARVDSDFDASFALASTDSLSEGSTNLYYTNARADARVNLQTGANLDLSQKSTSDLSEGTNKYYTKARVDSDFDASFALASTDSLSEGSTNLYFTNERVDDRVGALITGGVNVTATYDDAAGTLEIKVPFENIDDRVGAILTGGSGIDVNYDDPNATVTITNTLNTSDFTDSAFVTSRPVSTFTNDALYLDSTTAQNLINASYIQSNQIQYNTSNFTDSAFVTGLPISTFTNDKNYLDSTYAAALIDSAHIKAVVDSNYVQLIQADLQRDSSFISSIVTGGTLNMGANNIITTGKVLFANVYSQLSDLPSASTYHGMFAHVHATGKGYFAHAGAWVELANNSQLSNSGNWDTAFGWGNHASAGYQSAATALDSAMVYRFTIDSTRTTALVDAAYVQARQTSYNTSDFLDSTTVSGVVDNAYVQARQIQYNTSDFLDSTTVSGVVDAAYVQARQTSYNTSNFTDSAFVTGLPISTFTNDANYLDSTTVTDVINTAYVRARQALIDSDLTKLLVDSAYIQLRDRFQDSSLVTSTIDSAYINARVSTVDSAQVQAIIDSSYLEVIIDSDYVTARAGVVLDSASIASGVILTTVDAAYVQARQQKYNTSDFADSAFVTGLPVSTFTNDVQYLDSTTVQGVINASYIQSNQNDYLDSALTSQLIDSAYIALRTTAGTDSATVIGLIDSDYVASRVVAFANPIFTEFKYITDSAGQVVFEGNDANGNALSIETGNHTVFVNGIRLLPSDFTADVTNNRITLDSTGSASDEVVISTIKGKNALAGISIIDSDYIASRTIAIAQPKFVNNRYISSSNQTAFSGADINNQVLSLSPGNFQVFLNGIRLLDSDFTADTDNNTITLTSGATLNDEIVITTVIGQNAVAGIAAVDSAYVAARVGTVAQATKVYVDESEDDNVSYNITFVETNPGSNSHSSMQVDNGGLTFNPGTNNLFVAGQTTVSSTSSTLGGTLSLNTADTTIVDGNKLGTIRFAAPNEASGTDAQAVAAEIQAEADATFSATNNSTDLVFKLATSGATAEVARLTHEGNMSLTSGTMTATAFSGDGSALTGISAIDSALTIQLIDSAYVQARQVDLQRDSAFVTGIIDSAYIEPLLTPIHISGSNVGIGTGSSGHALTISANEYDGIQFQKDGADNGYIGIGTSNLFVGAAGNLIFHTGNASLTNGSERMRIDGNGRVLIGTTTLSAYSNRMLTVSGNNDATIEIRAASTSGHSQLVFSDGSAADNSSQRGYIIYDHADETFKFGAYDNQFMHASTFGSTDGYSAGRLAVGYNNNAANSNNRTVGLHVGGHRYYHRAMMVEDYDPHTSYSTNFITFIRNGNDAGEIVSTGATSTSYSTSSDYRVKNNIQDMDSAINIIKGLKPRKFTFKAEDSDGYTGRWINGFIAHELDSDLPLSQGIVIGTKDQVDSDGKAVMQGMDYGLMTPILTKALQEALEKIETLEAKVAALEGG